MKISDKINYGRAYMDVIIDEGVELVTILNLGAATLKLGDRKLFLDTVSAEMATSNEGTKVWEVCCKLEIDDELFDNTLTAEDFFDENLKTTFFIDTDDYEGTFKVRNITIDIHIGNRIISVDAEVED